MPKKLLIIIFIGVILLIAGIVSIYRQPQISPGLTVNESDETIWESLPLGYIKAVNINSSTQKNVISFDAVEFLSGQEAQKACLEDPKCYKDDICIQSGSCLPNNYLIRNSDMNVEDMVLANNVSIEIYDVGELKTVTAAEFKEKLNQLNSIRTNYFLVKLKNQEVIGIRQKYLP